MNSTTTRIMNAQEVSENIFIGKKSAWAILADARRGRIPHFSVGKRIFFDEASLRAWVAQQMAASIAPASTEQAPDTRYGIRKIR